MDKIVITLIIDVKITNVIYMSIPLHRAHFLGEPIAKSKL